MTLKININGEIGFILPALELPTTYITSRTNKLTSLKLSSLLHYCHNENASNVKDNLFLSLVNTL
jgi:hypothetical protein